MIVLSHRGYWHTPAEKNTEAAFRRSFDLGFGTETDVRDRGGELVISHDPPTGGEMRFGEFLDILGGRDLPLALNVKADGLAGRIKTELAGRPLSKWFVFDMSIPDTVQQLAQGNPAYGRLSEYEPQLPQLLSPKLVGVWLDGFHSEWWSPESIEELAVGGKSVCVVSPELHQRDPQGAWAKLRAFPFTRPARVQLCTDRPEQARAWFGGSA